MERTPLPETHRSKRLPASPAVLENSNDGSDGHDRAPFDFLAGGGELACLIAEYDWSQTPLGPIRTWPQSLKTSVSLILNSRHPMWIGWGKELTFLYNDAYISVLSHAKHPGALGRRTAEVWSEVWDICGPLADKVFAAGEASFLDDVQFLMNRGDFVEELYYSFSYSPIRDESGNVAGLFSPCNDVTSKVINARRLRTLSQLSARALLEKSLEGSCASAFAILGKNPHDIPFALLYLTDADGEQAHLKQACGLPPGVASLTPPTVDVDAISRTDVLWPLADVLKTAQSRTVCLKDVAGLPLGPAQQPLAEAMVLPVTSGGDDSAHGVLIAGVNPARRLDAEYRTFFELIASQIATAIQNARAAEEERKRLQALAEIDRAKTAFFSNVSHEFRTPLTLMLGPVEDLLARSHTDLSPAAKSQLELVNRNGSRLLRLVNTLLDFSRIEAGRMQAVYEATNLSAFTVELASVFRSATEKAGLQLEIDCRPLAGPVFVDRNMWEKIVLNLISNAFKFTFDGAIKVSLQQAGEQVELRVSDSGVGIPAEELPKLFDRFHRIENTRSRTHEGSGIGLALVHELVKLHGGSVRVESVLGRGSTFIVSMPLGSAHLPVEQISGTRHRTSTATGAAPFVDEALRWLPDTSHADPAGELPSGHEVIPVPCPPLAEGKEAEGRPHIVVADDNADMRQYLVRLLSERYQVHAAADGQEAFTMAQEHAPELILSDVMMPRLDGFGLLREMRADPKMRTIPIILLSARAGEESRVEGMEQGADDYLIKPFSARELLARVQTHLEMSRIRKAAAEEALQKEQVLNIALAASDTGTFRWSPETREFVLFDDNLKRLFGMTPDKQVKVVDDFIALIHPDDVAAVAPAVERACREGADFDMEYRVIHPDGSVHWLYDRARMERDAEGKPTYMVGACTDVTRRKQAEEEVRSQQERLRKTEKLAAAGQLAASLAHEINNPLSSVVNSLYLLENHSNLDDSAASLVRTASNELTRVARIVRQSLSYYREGSIPRAFDLADIAKDSVQVFGNKLQRSGVRLSEKMRGGTVLGFADEIRQVVDNLILNSMEAMPHGGRLGIAVHPSIDWKHDGRRGLRLTIADSGCGIPQGSRAKIFEPFFTTKPEKGTGLGLWVLRGIIAKHEGTISLRSSDRSGSSGTVISIFLPAHATATVPPEAKSEAA